MINTICLANTGRYSKADFLTLQFFSFKSSWKAGVIELSKLSTPKTLVKSPNFLNRLILTSESWSFKRFEKTGMMKSTVGFFPINKATDNIDPAKAPIKSKQIKTLKNSYYI